jgi:hypothetical protein
MNKNLLLLVLFFISIPFCNAQTDHELLKTAVNTNSKFKEQNKNLGYELVDVSARFGSHMEESEKMKVAITNREYIGDTLFVEVVTIANCCASFLCDLEVNDNHNINLLFELNDQDCNCLKGIYLNYKILVKQREKHTITLNGHEMHFREHDPNESREEMEYYPDGKIKVIKMYLGSELKRVTYLDEMGKRTKMLMYNNGKVIEKNF